MKTSTQAEHRFAQAIEAITHTHQDGNIAIVAHGTVIALFVARHNPIQAFTLWQQLSLPSFAVLTPPSYQMIDDIKRVNPV